MGYQAIVFHGEIQHSSEFENLNLAIERLLGSQPGELWRTEDIGGTTVQIGKLADVVLGEWFIHDVEITMAKVNNVKKNGVSPRDVAADLLGDSGKVTKGKPTAAKPVAAKGKPGAKPGAKPVAAKGGKPAPKPVAKTATKGKAPAAKPVAAKGAKAAAGKPKATRAPKNNFADTQKIRVLAKFGGRADAAPAKAFALIKSGMLVGDFKKALAKSKSTLSPTGIITFFIKKGAIKVV